MFWCAVLGKIRSDPGSCSNVTKRGPHVVHSRTRSLFEPFAFTLVPVPRILAPRRVHRRRMCTTLAVLLSRDLTRGSTNAGTDFVYHAILLPALQTSLHLHNDDILLREPNGIVTLRTQVLAQGCGHSKAARLC